MRGRGTKEIEARYLIRLDYDSIGDFIAQMLVQVAK